MPLLSLLALLVAVCRGSQYPGITWAEIEHYQDLLSTFMAGEQDPSVVFGNKHFLAPMFLRLVFHDCVGGCDGCINNANPDNGGLAIAVDALEKWYHNETHNISQKMSRADWWALAGAMGARHAANRQNHDGTDPDAFYPDWQFWYGRHDHPDCVAGYYDRDNVLPGPFMLTEEVLEYFYDEFGMSTKETVALMGAHGMGQARIAHSKFKGWWTLDRNIFSNDYYVEILDQEKFEWTPDELKNSGKWQWSHNVTGADLGVASSGIMLHADMAMLFNLTAINQTDGVLLGCDLYYECNQQQAITYPYMYNYSLSNEAFLTDFAEVLAKMQSRGYDPACLHRVTNVSNSTAAYAAGGPGCDTDVWRLSVELASWGKNDAGYPNDTCVMLVDGVDVCLRDFGFNLAVVNQYTGAVIETNSFDPSVSPAVANALSDYIDGIETGRVVLVATVGEAKDRSGVWKAALWSLNGTDLPTGKANSYVLAGRKGGVNGTHTWITEQRHGNGLGPSRAAVQVPLVPDPGAGSGSGSGSGALGAGDDGGGEEDEGEDDGADGDGAAGADDGDDGDDDGDDDALVEVVLPVVGAALALLGALLLAGYCVRVRRRARKNMAEMETEVLPMPPAGAVPTGTATTTPGTRPGEV